MLAVVPALAIGLASTAAARPRTIGSIPLLGAAPRTATLRNSHWAGYAVHARSRFREVRGTWTMPEVTCHRGRESAISLWVGLGGFTAHERLEQTGTEARCGIRGRSFRYAWFELYPAPTVVTPVRVRAGDQIEASVGVHGGRVEMQMKDLTSGAHFSKTLSMDSPDAGSAEWIAETPPDCNPLFTKCRFVPAPHFGSAEFAGTRAATSAGAMSGIDAGPFSVTAISLVDHAGRVPSIDGLPPLWGSNTAVIPSPLSADGESFTVTRKPVPPRRSGHKAAGADK